MNKVVLPIHHEEDLKFKKNVYIAYMDVLAAGSRAFFGLDMSVHHFSLDIKELMDFKPACIRGEELKPSEIHYEPLQVLNCKYEEFTFVIINLCLLGEHCHYVANKIIDMCLESKVSQVNIYTALRLKNQPIDMEPMYENCLFTNPDTKNTSVPDNTMICDPFLCTLIQMIQIEQLPTHIYIVNGHSAFHGKACDEDGSKQAIRQIHKTVSKISGLMFDEEKSFSVIYDGADDSNVDTVSMMYS